MVWVEALVPFDKGELLSSIHKLGIVERTVSVLTDHLSFFNNFLKVTDVLTACVLVFLDGNTLSKLFQR